MHFIRFFISILLVFYGVATCAQTPYTLEQCLTAAETYTPLSKQEPLIEAAHRAAIAQLRTNYMPQTTFNGTATWQSEVTAISIPLPNFEGPTISKDQYRLTLEVIQPIWDGGQTAHLTKIQTAQTQIEQQRVRTDRYAAREQILQLYCAALLAQKQEQALIVSKKDIVARRTRTQEQVDNGIGIPAYVMAFDARLLEMEQLETEALFRRTSAIEGLSLLTGLPVSSTDSLALPNMDFAANINAERPELALFSLQQAGTVAQQEATRSKIMPRFNALATLGYARPGLNFLSNDFEPYAILGVNFRWNLSGLYNGGIRKENQQFRLQSERIGLQKEQFLRQLSVRQIQQGQEIRRIRKVMEKDQGIINLRDQIAATAAIQLENGVVTPSEYLTETTNLTTAKLNAIIHEVQLVQAQLQLVFMNGNL